MDEKNNFALVRKPTSAVEKVAPGAKRILSGMVADAHALAKSKERKKLRIVILDDDSCIFEIYEHFICECCKDATVLKFNNGDQAWQELLLADPDLLITDLNHFGLNGREMLLLLARKKVRFPILVSSGNLTEKDVRQYAGSELNISFLSKPFDNKILTKILEAALKIPRDSTTPDETKPINNLTKIHKPRGKLLIVDGEDGPRRALRVIFEREYDLFTAENGPMAIELVKQRDIDVVVLDTLAGMGMSGIEVLERLKYLKPDIEVIIMTAFETADTRRRALQLRASDYINKPFDLATMRAAISKAMRHHTHASEITAAI